MNRVDAIYRRALEQEKFRLCHLPTQEILAMEFFATQNVQVDGRQIHIVLWHEEPERRGESDHHSFVLQAQRRLFPMVCFHRNYLEGFAVDSAGIIVEISEEVLNSYD